MFFQDVQRHPRIVLGTPSPCRGVASSWTTTTTYVYDRDDPALIPRQHFLPPMFQSIEGVNHTLVVEVTSGETLLQPLRSIVQSDGLVHPKIDSVVLMSEDFIDYRKTWDALDGLSPRHLSVYTGFAEECHIVPLLTLKTPWPLETFTLHGTTSERVTNRLPSDVLRTIPSVTLDHCSAELSPPGDAPTPSAVRRIAIIENHASTMFVEMRHIGVIPDSVEALVIKSNGFVDLAHDYEGADLVKALETCTALETLSLAYTNLEPEDICKGAWFACLPRAFAPSIKHLRFSGPLPADMEVWMECAGDVGWLPRLETAVFGLGWYQKEFLRVLMSKRPNLVVQVDHPVPHPTL